MNYHLLTILCIAIITCYTAGFICGILFEKSSQKDRQKLKENDKSKKITGKVRR